MHFALADLTATSVIAPGGRPPPLTPSGMPAVPMPGTHAVHELTRDPQATGRAIAQLAGLTQADVNQDIVDAAVMAGVLAPGAPISAVDMGIAMAALGTYDAWVSAQNPTAPTTAAEARAAWDRFRPTAYVRALCSGSARAPWFDPSKARCPGDLLVWGLVGIAMVGVVWLGTRGGR